MIRPSREADAEAYRELRLAGLRAHPEVFGADYATSAAQPIEHWQERAHRGAGGEHGITYFAEAGGDLVGVTVLIRDASPKLRHTGYLVSVYVMPEWRGMGIADGLIEACLAWGRELGLRLVRLSVVTSNTAAIRRYARLGFTVYGVEPEAIAYGGAYYDELLMVKHL
jgi:RimJ/RimL family protein N-acetyltransferase